MQTPILKSSRLLRVRILRPLEYSDLRDHGAILEGYKAQMDGLLCTGMRYVEAQRLQLHPDWFRPEGFVYLPPEAMLKGKRRQLDRWVKLNPFGLRSIPSFLKARKLPGWETWTVHLRKWAEIAGLDPVGLGPKTMRKTWESWMVSTYPNRLAEVTMSQGHTAVTAVGHYLNMPFLAEDKAAMLPYVEGMF